MHASVDPLIPRVTAPFGAGYADLALAIGGGLMLAEVAVAFALPAIFGAFACAVVTGIVFGFMPARK
ncbi:MAG: hypothetical protein RSH52_21375, partial [Janthinobacterium sp.]